MNYDLLFKTANIWDSHLVLVDMFIKGGVYTILFIYTTLLLFNFIQLLQSNEV